jgi:NAD(P)-dependent dehydrogenase (short-subunit alcohol dehydrogenase family)
MPDDAFMDRFRLDGRVAIVTGASSGLGAAIARALGAAGADLVLAARRPDGLARTRCAVEELGRRAVAVEADVTDPEACERVASTAIEAFGRLDVAVNCAGVGAAVPALREAPEDFRRVVDVNLAGTYLMAQAAARRMENGGAIVNVSSVAALLSVGLPQAAYASSKAGVIGLTRDLAQQWTGRRGIRVNAVVPGFFRTEMTEGWFESHWAEQQRLVPAERAGDPYELAAVVVFLAGDAAAYVTGQALPVDGGRSLL